MAKWGNPSDETHDIITEVLVGANLDTHARTKIIVNDDQKKVLDIKKETDANLFAYGYHMKITVNELIFDGLTDEYKLLATQEVLAGTHWDFENDKLVVNQPNKIHRAFVDKYGWEKYESLKEIVDSLYDSQKNEANLNGE